MLWQIQSCRDIRKSKYISLAMSVDFSQQTLSTTSEASKTILIIPPTCNNISSFFSSVDQQIQKYTIQTANTTNLTTFDQHQQILPINQHSTVQFLQLIFKRLKKMAQSVPIRSFDSEIIYDSEESIHHKHCEDSFLDQVLEKGFEEESETGIKRDPSKKKTKQILKPTIVQSPTPLFPVAINVRKRNNTKSGKWSGSNRTNYYKSILKFSTQHPYYTISWKYWKPEKFYPKMIEEINKNETYYQKDVIQTKSFDERQRKQYFEKEPGLDMIELSLMKLRELEQMDDSVKEVILKFEQKRKEKSQHMELLDELISKFNEKKYDVDDLYYKIMGRQPIIAGDQNNSVFYS